MKNFKIFKQVVLGCFFLLIGWNLQAQNTVSGTVTEEGGDVLIGANIVIKGTSDGTVTDSDGQFTISSTKEFPWTLEIIYTGFNEKSLEITRSTNDLQVVLSEGVLAGEVIVSASRKPEKAQDAPASVSVISSKKN